MPCLPCQVEKFKNQIAIPITSPSWSAIEQNTFGSSAKRAAPISASLVSSLFEDVETEIEKAEKLE